MHRGVPATALHGPVTRPDQCRAAHMPNSPRLKTPNNSETSPMNDFDMIVIGSGPSGPPRCRPGGQARQVGPRRREGPPGRRCFGPYRHDPVQDAARDGAQSLGLARARLLRPLLPGQAGHRARHDLIARLHKTLDHEVEVLEHQFSRNGVKTAIGEARFVGPHEIEVTADKRRDPCLSARRMC